MDEVLRKEMQISRIRSVIRSALLSRSKRTDTKSFEYLGITGEEYYKYLKSIGWNPEIHEIDHIIPIHAFNVFDNEQVKQCFNYKNTQPLTPYENKVKRNNMLDNIKNSCNNIGEAN